MARASTGMAFGKIAGKMGDFVVVETRSGLALRKKATYRKAVSPRQRAAGARMKAATLVWNEMTAAQAQAWNRYAAGLTHHNPLTGEPYAPIGYNVFCGLAMRVLQIDPAASVPLLPPSGSFMSDAIQVGGVGAEGGIRFSASGPNAPGVVTELMIQRLANERRTPTAQYTSAAFVTFAVGHVSAEVPMEPGIYACAYRFTERATGRTSLLQTLGVVTVE